MTLSDIYVKEQLDAFMKSEWAQKDRRGILRHQANLASARKSWRLRIAQSLQNVVHLFHNRTN